MSAQDHPPAREPDDLGRFFIERFNAGDVEGLLALYEPDSVAAFDPANISNGHDDIREVLANFVASGQKLEPGEPLPTLRLGDLALTSTRLANGQVTTEVARRQQDGTWRWAIDQPNTGAT